MWSIQCHSQQFQVPPVQHLTPHRLAGANPLPPLLNIVMASILSAHTPISPHKQCLLSGVGSGVAPGARAPPCWIGLESFHKRETCFAGVRGAEDPASRSHRAE